MPKRIREHIDDYVDYKAEYMAVIKQPRVVGDSLTGLCPFHEDSNPSFSVNLKNGKCTCHAGCGSWNFITFWGKLYGVDNKEAAIEIAKKYGKYQEPEPEEDKGKGRKRFAPYSVHYYSIEKRIPEDFLLNVCKVRDGKTRGGTTRLEIPYYHIDGSVASMRYRYGGKDFQWEKGSSGKLCLYGEWRLPEFREHKNYVCLVEGESDTQSLWYMGINALGAPGASNLAPERASHLDGMRIYIHQEPDSGGEKFRQGIVRTLESIGFTGQTYVWQCKQIGGKKDPSEVLMAYGRDKGRALIMEQMKGAQLLDIKLEVAKETLPNVPIALDIPEGWIVRATGVFKENTGAKAEIEPETLICRTPLLIARRLKAIDADGEKVQLTFLRDGHWHFETMLRSDAFNNRSIVSLANRGCTISSSNASKVVEYLTALEQTNLDNIPVAESASRFGWHAGNRFFPGHAGELTMDLDYAQRSTAEAMSASGTLEQWLDLMRPHRERFRFRFILAASFAAPLLKIVKGRNFMVYNWGGSRGGKTAALKAALSAWGDPERMMISFNSTQVALERMSALFCDLPLGIDERQLAGSSQSWLEKIVYMLGSGVGKARGAKAGGLQRTETWRAIAIATGEEPLSQENSQAGVSTRVVDIYGGPFEEESDASNMHRMSGALYGTAGPAYIGKLLEKSWKDVCQDYQDMYDSVSAMKTDNVNGAQLSYLATVALADEYLSSMLFGENEFVSSQSAQSMAREIIALQSRDTIPDVNVSALEFVSSWISENSEAFADSGRSIVRFGEWDETDEGVVYILPNPLRKALEDGGYSYLKTMKYMADEGLAERDRNGKNTIVRRFGGKVSRMVKFRFGDWSARDSSERKATAAAEDPDWIP